MDYRRYITSNEWRSKHKDFLKSSHYRCAFFPWVKVGKKHRYNVHHMNYENLGSERLWVDVVCLCPFAHSFIIHGLLSGFSDPLNRSVTRTRLNGWLTPGVVFRF
jgi:hypothetical protein